MKYFISSTSFTSKKKAIEQLEAWQEAGELDEGAKVIVGERIFKPVIKTAIELKEEK